MHKTVNVDLFINGVSLNINFLHLILGKGPFQEILPWSDVALTLRVTEESTQEICILLASVYMCGLKLYGPV